MGYNLGHLDMILYQASKKHKQLSKCNLHEQLSWKTVMDNCGEKTIFLQSLFDLIALAVRNT